MKQSNFLLPLISVQIAIAACAPSSEGKGTSAQGHGSDAVFASSGSDHALAFPGAAGYGAHARGGRGGKIISVTTLADSGPGSLRECIDQEGPRVCVFRVSGIIRFTTRPPRILHPFLTIAGETAPGDGITLAHAGGTVGRTPLLIKKTHDIIVRNIRIRNDREGDERESEDSITIENSTRVIIDHVSASWARDEVVNGFADNDWITVSNSIFAYGIPKHDKCALLASDPTKPQHFSFIGNVCAHNGDRNPDINFPPDSCVEVVNNVFYNAQSEFAEVWETYGGTPVSLVGNYFKAGPDTTHHAVGVVRQTIGSKHPGSIYLEDNAFEGDFIHVTQSAKALVKGSPNCAMTIKALSARAAYRTVLDHAGSWPRDGIDQQVISDVRNGTGRITRQPGTIPAFAEFTPYPDQDADGMDDRWELENGADPARYDPWKKAEDGQRSIFEAFLQYIAKERGL